MSKRGRSEIESPNVGPEVKKPALADVVIAASLQKLFSTYPGDIDVNVCSLSEDAVKTSEALYLEELSKNDQEIPLPIDQIQGDVVLGFNKPHNLNIIFDLRRNNQGKIDLTPTEVATVRTSLLKIIEENELTTLAKMITHRSVYRALGTNNPMKAQVLWNISFGYDCLNTFTKGTTFERTMESFPSDSPFTIGATERSLAVGDHPVEEKWEFGTEWNNDILISLASDDYNAMIEKGNKIKGQINTISADLKSPLISQVNQTFCYRGEQHNPKDAFYGHEHFGFLDGLSQPEVRGKYPVTDKPGGYDFIVRRRLLAEPATDPKQGTSSAAARCPHAKAVLVGDQRYKDYSRPGFRLMDVGHFLLGYNTTITDTNDGPMQNPNPDKYRDLIDPCPDWAKNGSYVAYRKMKQDVTQFWQFFYQQAVTIVTTTGLPSFRETFQKLTSDEQEETIKQIAGGLAAQSVGRWWDGTPVTFGPPISGFFYPPKDATFLDSISVHNLAKREGLLNCFNFALATNPWKINLNDKSLVTISGKNGSPIRGDFGGAICPFAGHIRKVNPRDEFTDIGSDKQTLKHRLIRRGNNYYEGIDYEKDVLNFDRVKDVFHPTPKEEQVERGLALITYQADIEFQFEFIQHHWANSATRPRSVGDDFVIGQKDKSETKTIFISDDYFFKNIVQTPYEISVPSSIATFTSAKGLGYFLLLPVNSLHDILNAPLIIRQDTTMNDPPAFLTDFRNPSNYALWDQNVDYQYWKGLWSVVGTDQGTPDEIDDMSYAGVAYRFERDKIAQKSLIDAFNKHIRNKTPLPRNLPLQFYSTKDFIQMVKAETNPAVPLTNVIISWSGFPKRILDLFHNSDVNPYEYVEQLGWPSKDLGSPTNLLARQMDEYCEWFTHRNNDGKITRIDISCESPEYWTFLMQYEPSTALELYRKYVSPDVQLADLVLLDEKTGKTSYNLYNKWNTTHGLMHLNCPPNSLFAEVYIAAEASTRWGVPYPKCTHLEPNENYTVATNGSDLILSGQYGLPTRNSDPTIGYNVNYYARAGLLMTVANPVGLYFADLNTTGWTKPNGTLVTKEELSQMIHYERGAQKSDHPHLAMNYHSRIRIECPASFGFVLGDCKIGGSRLDYAGKLIDSSLTVFLVALGFKPKNGFNFDDDLYGMTVPPKDDWATLNFLNNKNYQTPAVPPPGNGSNSSSDDNKMEE
eukprot:gene14329-15850_t